MTATTLIDRLQAVRQTGPGRWLARCPAHEDRSPSLSIRETDRGKVLLTCFAGCGALDVLDAVGLDWSALFPPNERQCDASPTRGGIPARDLLVILDHEVLVTCIILADIIKNRKVGEDQLKRLLEAAGRIGRARDMVNPLEVRRAS